MKTSWKRHNDYKTDEAYFNRPNKVGGREYRSQALEVKRELRKLACY